MPSTKKTSEDSDTTAITTPVKKQKDAASTKPHKPRKAPDADTPTKKTPRIKEIAKNIKKLQADETVILRKAPVESVVRELLQSYDPKHRIRPKALKLIRLSVEAKAMGLSWRVREYAQHANRTTIQAKDFMLYAKVNPDEKISLDALRAAAVVTPPAPPVSE